MWEVFIIDFVLINQECHIKLNRALIVLRISHNTDLLLCITFVANVAYQTIVLPP